ncbi:MAG: Nudix family hydrolase [Methylophilus sp.]
MTKVVQVAVAILQKQNGEYLLASRPHGKGWAGWWEFPGGKIEKEEHPEQALTRELQEELGITPTKIQAWIKRRYDYPASHDAEAKTVLLHFYFVQEWQGDPAPLEGQTLAWQHPQQLNVSPILPANAPIMRALSLPSIYAISNVAEMGESAFLDALKIRLDEGLQLLQLRENQLSEDALKSLSERILAICAPYTTKVLLNGSPENAALLGMHGVHLNRHMLMQTQKRPHNEIVAASCHNTPELQQAKHLNLDFAVLSPVLPTQSHPEAQGIGWDQFTQLTETLELPVYALGGMQIKMLNDALKHGARGIAMQRSIWVL